MDHSPTELIKPPEAKEMWKNITHQHEALKRTLTGKSELVQDRKGGESRMCPLYIQAKEGPKKSSTLNRSKMKRTAWQVCKNITGNKKNIKKNPSMQKTKKKKIHFH